MQRFSRLFWLMVMGGTVSSALLDHALVGHLAAQMHDMVGLCTARNDACGTRAFDRALQVFCLMVLAGNVLAFWLAYRVGRGLIKPAATDAAQ